MSEQQNIQVVKDAYAAFGRGDIQSILNSCAADVVWVSPGEGYLPQAGTFRGHDAVARFFQLVGQNMDFTAFEPRSYVAQGDVVVALGYYRATVKQTGKTFESNWAMTFTLRGGEIAEFQEYTNTAGIASAYAVAKAA